ncbi:hypothetical protein APR04_004564 [Promicromonospora umidemergens]|uniref:Uncharacterized protein n=1 Tax=Promicromonospora umidemergens TaxID=629679 RepID=A0ABP8XKE8_9MICO|nr:hypothetical protein [Promicromonospora umidemergens]MCP2285629.1 hypothetical protein [Promicromonospora umidemergens]
MTASDRFVEAESGAETEAEVAGATRISARALEHLAVCLVRDAAHVQHRQVSVRLADDDGGLTVWVSVPVAVGPNTAGSAAERGSRLRRGVIVGMRDLAGRTVTAVDVRFSGVHQVSGRRVW